MNFPQNLFNFKSQKVTKIELVRDNYGNNEFVITLKLFNKAGDYLTERKFGQLGQSSCDDMISEMAKHLEEQYNYSSYFDTVICLEKSQAAKQLTFTFSGSVVKRDKILWDPEFVEIWKKRRIK